MKKLTAILALLLLAGSAWPAPTTNKWVYVMLNTDTGEILPASVTNAIAREASNTIDRTLALATTPKTGAAISTAYTTITTNLYGITNQNYGFAVTGTATCAYGSPNATNYVLIGQTNGFDWYRGTNSLTNAFIVYYDLDAETFFLGPTNQPPLLLDNYPSWYSASELGKYWEYPGWSTNFAFFVTNWQTYTTVYTTNYFGCTNAIQLGQGTNNTLNTFQVWTWTVLDYLTGLLYSGGHIVLTNESDTLQQVVNRGNSATNVGALTAVDDWNMQNHSILFGNAATYIKGSAGPEPATDYWIKFGIFGVDVMTIGGTDYYLDLMNRLTLTNGSASGLSGCPSGAVPTNTFFGVGTNGIVHAPSSGDVAATNYLGADGAWHTVPTGSSSGGGADAASTNYFRNWNNLTNLPAKFSAATNADYASVSGIASNLTAAQSNAFTLAGAKISASTNADYAATANIASNLTSGEIGRAHV